LPPLGSDESDEGLPQEAQKNAVMRIRAAATRSRTIRRDFIEVLVFTRVLSFSRSFGNLFIHQLVTNVL
jgi:hypothetical protein